MSGNSNSNGCDSRSSTSTIKILDAIRHRPKDGPPAVSLEYFPPRSHEGVVNLKARMERMQRTVSPLFADITWGAGGSTSDLSLELAVHMQQTAGMTANLHLTCTNLVSDSVDPVHDIRVALQHAVQNGVTNIVALRGDPPAGQQEWKAAAHGGFTCALDLVRFIRKEFGNDTFGISVAGYPEGHPVAITEVVDPTTMTATERARSSTVMDAETGTVRTFTCRDDAYAAELAYLQQKVDAGADFIITQMFFDTAVYHQFVKDCRAIGIACPILPGIMCITGAAGFFKMTAFCKTRVPESLRTTLTALQADEDSEDKIKEFGIQFGAEQCRQLLAGDEPPPVLHFYTLNLEKVVYGVLIELGLLSATAVAENAGAESVSAAVAVPGGNN